MSVLCEPTKKKNGESKEKTNRKFRQAFCRAVYLPSDDRAAQPTPTELKRGEGGGWGIGGRCGGWKGVERVERGGGWKGRERGLERRINSMEEGEKKNGFQRKK